MNTTTTTVEIPRDRWGRPLVMREGTDTRLPYRRTTTFVGCLDDTWNLMKWKTRQTAYGMGQRPDLVLAATAASPDDKRKLNDIAEAAAEHALASSKATIGTALHSLTERIDRGEPLGPIPADAAADLAAYEKTMKRVSDIHAIEQFRVFDDWQVAGTADRALTIDGDTVIADVKTGDIKWSAAKIAMQLAMYARSTPYDIGSDSRYPGPTINQKRGLIIHLPAGTGECHLVWVDIEKGWRGCQLAKQVWDWRGEKNLTWDVADPDTTIDVLSWEQKACRATSVEELRALWRSAKAAGEDTATFLAVCETRKRQLS